MAVCKCQTASRIIVLDGRRGPLLDVGAAKIELEAIACGVHRDEGQATTFFKSMVNPGKSIAVKSDEREHTDRRSERVVIAQARGPQTGLHAIAQCAVDQSERLPDLVVGTCAKSDRV